MDSYQEHPSLLPPPLTGPRGSESPRPEVEEDRIVSGEAYWKPVPVQACDGVRQLAVVVWARGKSLERTLAGREDTNPRLAAGLARIDVAIGMMAEPLDALEDLNGR